MTLARRLLLKPVAAAALAGLAVGATGCQTYPAGFGGMTLPSPHYLKHYPQYFPPDPQFRLQREFDSMQDPEGAFGRGLPGAAGGLGAPPAVAPPLPSGNAPAGPNQSQPPAGGPAGI